MTRAGIGKDGVKIWSSLWEDRQRWHWSLRYSRENHGPFPTLEAAIADAQATLGAMVPITHHSADAPPRAEGGGV